MNELNENLTKEIVNIKKDIETIKTSQKLKLQYLE